MNSAMNPLHTRLRSFAFASGTAAMLVAIAVLVGWTAVIPRLVSIAPSLVAMKPVTAICFFLSGLSLSLLAPLPLNSTRRYLAQGAALIVTVIGAAAILECATGFKLPFEQLFPHSLFALGIPPLGHISLTSAIAFVLLSLALHLLDRENPYGLRPAQFLSLAVVLLCLIHLIGYLYGVDDLNRAASNNFMAIHTTLVFLLLSLALIAARPDCGLIAFFNAPGLAGRMSRRILPAAIFLTVVIGWFRLFGERRGYYGPAFGAVIFASASILMFSILIGFASRSLSTSIEQLNAASRDLARTNDRANHANFRLAAIIESSDDAIISKNLDGVITSWNAGAERIFGYSAAEAVGQSVRMLLLPDRYSEETDVLSRIAQGESVKPFESIRIRKDGRAIMVFVTVSPLRDAAGIVIGASKIARDISETRRIEQALQEQEARLAAIIGGAMDAVITVDECQRITMFNPAAETMFGCVAADVLGSGLDRLIPERFRVAHAEHLGEFARSKVTRRPMGRTGSIFGVRCDGDEFPIEASISQAIVRGEKLFTVIIRDVTDRLRSEEDRQHAVLLDLAPVLVRDVDNRIVLWTRGAQHLYGYSKEEAIGRSSHDLLQTQFSVPREEVETAFDRDGFWEGELRHHTRDGRTVIVASQWVLHHDAQGKPARILEVSADLTALKYAQSLLLRSQKLESLGTLAGGIAHDFNNILLAINGNAKLALDDLPAGHPARRNLSEIAKAGARAADLIRRILSFSRPQEQNIEPQAVQPVVEEALKLVRATLPSTVQIESSFSPDLPAVALDSTQLHQIVVNLATNSSHAIGDKPGIITVGLSNRLVTPSECVATPDLHEGRYVCLSFSDNGAGMDRATLDRIFDPFFTTKPVGKGTGLGLSVVQGIVSSHGGAVTAQSELGRGTSLVLFFPAVEASSRAPIPAPVPALPLERGRQENILYVDDEEGLVMLGTLFLQRLGYQVTGHIDAAVALHDFSSRPDEFAAVVTDLSMPQMSGFDFARELLRLRPGLPIIVTSGYVRPEDQKVAESLGIIRIIPKPSTIDDLGQALNQVLHHNPVPVPLPAS
jgi:PAS domain S-box-containing protein